MPCRPRVQNHGANQDVESSLVTARDRAFASASTHPLRSAALPGLPIGARIKATESASACTTDTFQSKESSIFWGSSMAETIGKSKREKDNKPARVIWARVKHGGDPARTGQGHLGRVAAAVSGASRTPKAGPAKIRIFHYVYVRASRPFLATTALLLRRTPRARVSAAAGHRPGHVGREAERPIIPGPAAIDPPHGVAELVPRSGGPATRGE
jgi:hypothetical protein